MIREQKTLRILEIGHDPWLGSRHNADFLQAGVRLVPGKFGQKARLKQVLPILIRLAKRKYDVIAICQLQVDRISGLSRKSRSIKKVLAIAMHFKGLSWLLRQILCGSRAAIVIFDIGYGAKLSEAALKIFRPVLYFKRNLLEEYIAGEQGIYRVLPMAVVRQLKKPKTCDVFAAGSFFVAGRKLTLLAAQRLEELGWKVDIVKSTIPYEEYRQRLARAKVAFCLQGFGFHTWRMYEAALAGCVPVLDHPKEPIFHEFVDGENCLMIQLSVEEMVSRIHDLLQDDRRTERLSTAAQRMAESKHTFDSCGDYLAEEIRRAIQARQSERSRHWLDAG